MAEKLKSAEKRFDKNISRALSLVAGNEEEVRFSIVIGVAAMDDYFTRKFCDNLSDFIKENQGLTEELANLFDKAGFTVSKAIELLAETTTKETGRPFRVVRSVIEKQLEQK